MTRMMRLCVIGVALSACLLSAHRAPTALRPAGAILHVDDDAQPGGDGLSWNAAFCHLQDALSAARARRGIVEIRVAQGTYKPDQGQGLTPGDVNSAFDLVDQIVLRGGYAGIGAPGADGRDFAAFVTILSGDLLGNDRPNFTNYTDNSYRVVRATGLDLSTLMEGFTIIASQREPGEPLVGGGIYCSFGDLTVQDCRFERNRAYRGAGFAVRSGHLQLRRCSFIGNHADHSAGGDVRSDASALAEDCAFNYNFTFPHDGGALGLPVGLSPPNVIRRCTFRFNQSPNDAGGIYGGGPNSLVEDCVFFGNHAGWMAGAVANASGSFVRCRFENNTASQHGGAYANVNSQLIPDARFIACDFIANSTNSQTGGAASGGAAFVNCRFIGNRSGAGAGGPIAPGGAIRAQAPTTLIANCTFVGNIATSAGGAIDVLPGSATTVINSTFSSNLAGMTGQAINGSATIRNSVFGQHNGGAPLAGVGSVTYSIVPPGSPLPAGPGNILGDARFVNALGRDGIAGTEDDDLRLRADSPCIDAGDTTALPTDQFDIDNDGDTREPLPLDAFGNRRALQTPATPDTGIPATPPGAPPFYSAIVDMGAAEYRRPADVSPSIGDGYVDVDDLIAVIVQWGPCPAPPTACPADIDGDGEVGVDDLIAVLLGWG